ncbi:MAG TPA: ABC transporter permease [Bryobacteraceae bacterium]|nr:ABC transporter permease [Bryobacteraceae bacterium]
MNQRAWEPLDRVAQDVRYAFRSLRKSPGFAAAAILTLALGIGANTAIFRALEGVVMAPLPYSEPDRLVIVALYNRSLKYDTYLSYPDFLDWQRDARSFQQIAAFTPLGFDLASPGSPEHVDGDEVSSNFFSTLGVRLALGRTFTVQEEQFGGMPAAVISHRLWRDRFSGDPAALGKPITLNGAGYTIVGVLQPDFRFGDRQADVYTTIGGGAGPLTRTDRTLHYILCIARLESGVGIGQARAELNNVQEHIDQLNPSTEKGLGTSIYPLKRFVVGDVGGTLLLLQGAVGLVLLIACANVANLSLARSTTRMKEFAVRQALGAPRMQVVRQLITESVLLSLIGGILGLVVAKYGLAVVLALAPRSLPRVDNIGVNASVLLFALCVSVMAGILFSLAPALKHSNTDLQTGLKEAGRGSTGGHHHTQDVLAIVQIALALVLLSGAGLLFRTIRNLQAVNPGFDTQHLITFQVGLSPSVTRKASSTRIAYQQIVERIRQIAGVEAADITALLPLGEGDNSGPFWIGPHQPASMAEIPRAIYYPTGPDYLRTMEIPLLRGRFLTSADNIHSERVVLIDSILARTYFPGRDAVGRTITIPHWGVARALPARIVGVVGHVEQYGLDNSAGEKPQIYYSFYQLPDELVPVFRGEVTLAVRTPLDPAAVMPAIGNVVHGVGSDQPVYNIRTMRNLVSRSMMRQSFPMILLVAFAVLALLLACVGIYGVISYSTARRVPEIGIRMALGAAKWNVIRMLVAQGLRLALAGVAIGAAAALSLTRMLASFSRLLYGVPAADPLTFLGVSLFLIFAACLACFIPARRAAQLDPMTALHDE